MPSKRLNIMLYSPSSGEQIILPVNPLATEIKYEKEIETINILYFGKINIMGERQPLRIVLSHFLPEDDSPFAKNAVIMYDKNGKSDYVEYGYSSAAAVNIMKKWANEKNLIRLVIDDELNIEAFVVSFSQTLRETTLSKPFSIEIIEYRSPKYTSKTSFGLLGRISGLNIPGSLVAKANDTVYSIASKYGLDYKKIQKNNGIDNPNSFIKGKKLNLRGCTGENNN